jgi:hypothetical protein
MGQQSSLTGSGTRCPPRKGEVWAKTQMERTGRLRIEGVSSVPGADHFLMVSVITPGDPDLTPYLAS